MSNEHYRQNKNSGGQWVMVMIDESAAPSNKDLFYVFVMLVFAAIAVGLQECRSEPTPAPAIYMEPATAVASP